MNDKELADRVVALGVANSGPDVGVDLEPTGETNYFPPGGDWGMSAEVFVRHPAVAMALLERCDYHEIAKHNKTWHVEINADGGWDHLGNAESDSLPRAIVEAAVMALEAK